MAVKIAIKMARSKLITMMRLRIFSKELILKTYWPRFMINLESVPV